MEIGKKEISVRKAWELHPSQSVRPAAMGGERWAVCSAAAELQAGGTCFSVFHPRGLSKASGREVFRRREK